MRRWLVISSGAVHQYLVDLAKRHSPYRGVAIADVYAPEAQETEG